MKKLTLSFVLLTFLLMSMGAGAGERHQATLYKNPHCLCCDAHGEHLREHGFEVEEIVSHELPVIKQEHKVPRELAGCHTLLVDGYVVEGHVPASVILHLLEERPAIDGISLPGMPTGSPGMPGPKHEPFRILSFADGEVGLYAVE